MNLPVDETGAELSRAEDQRRAEEAQLLAAVRAGKPEQAVEIAETVAKAHREES